MKKSFCFLLCVLTFAVSAQDFDGHKWKAPYTLPTPEGWGVERFLIPIEFAPSIPYKGVEDIRFTPGWGNAKSEEYWSYAFLWYLDEMPLTTAQTIQNNINAYYTGLIGRNIERRKIPAEKLFPIKSLVKEVDAERGDLKTFKGSITMLDYMEQKPISLNLTAHVKPCPNQMKGFIFYEISPQPSDHKVWSSLDLLWKNFDCNAASDTK